MPSGSRDASQGRVRLVVEFIGVPVAVYQSRAGSDNLVMSILGPSCKTFRSTRVHASNHASRSGDSGTGIRKKNWLREDRI